MSWRRTLWWRCLLYSLKNGVTTFTPETHGDRQSNNECHCRKQTVTCTSYTSLCSLGFDLGKWKTSPKRRRGRRKMKDMPCGCLSPWAEELSCWDRERSGVRRVDGAAGNRRHKKKKEKKQQTTTVVSFRLTTQRTPSCFFSFFPTFGSPNWQVADGGPVRPFGCWWLPKRKPTTKKLWEGLL